MAPIIDRDSPQRRQRTYSGCSFTTSCDENEDPGEQRVEDVHLSFFYKPRTITLLSGLLIMMFYFAFVRDPESNQIENLWHGFLGVCGMFLVISLLICPNGPFVRPHPALWRLVLGVSILYSLLLVFALFQSYASIREMLFYLDPELRKAVPDLEVYAEDCSWTMLWKRLDVFCIAHFLGWAVKAMMLRHAGLTWLLSIMWEVTEIAFSHLLQNFKECWWDSVVLDVLICNGLGIHAGLYICKKLEMRQYYWESVKDIHGAKKKLRRAVMQFTPVSWTEVRWMDPKCGRMRYLALCLICIVWQVCELNTFFLKHIFIIPTSHRINLIRVGLITLVTTPTLRQFYIYVTDTRCKRVGTQCWMFVCMTFLEAILCVRHAKELFSQTDLFSIVWWLVFQMAVCFALLYFLVVIRTKRSSQVEPAPAASSSSASKSGADLRFARDVVESREYEGDEEEDEPRVRTRRTLRRAAKDTST